MMILIKTGVLENVVKGKDRKNTEDFFDYIGF